MDSFLKDFLLRLKKIPNYWLVMATNTLEFFDLFLYVHLAAVLHVHFFPQDSLFMSETFSLANIYFIAPILSCVFALYGDNRGRKPIVIGCAILMALSTALVAMLPTYGQVGILATGSFIFLRILQGIALAGEPYAAALYVIESVPIKKCPFYFSILCATENLGSMFALLLATLTLHYDLSWRIPFICAFFVVLVTSLLRSTLTETEEYVKHTDVRSRVQIYKIDDIKNFYNRLPFKQINTLCVGLVNFGYPFAFVTSYIYLGKHLGEFYGYTLAEIAAHNILVVFLEMILRVAMGYFTSRSSLSCHVIQAARMVLAMGAALTMPYVLTHYHTIWLVLAFQVVFVSCMATDLVIGSVYKVFPVIGRFTLMSMGHIGNRFICFFLMTFVLHHLVQHYGLWGNVMMMMAGCSLVLLGLYLYMPYDEKRFEKNREPMRHQYI
jgi:MFS family permease